jgi:RNA polymerase sigma-70 factor (ECF subfamily)
MSLLANYCHIISSSGVYINERASYRFWVKLMTVTSNNAKFSSQRIAAVSEDFEATFLNLWPKVYNVLFRLLGDKAEAEDLALETFWRLYQNPPSSRDNLNGWLYRVAVNLGFNALRSQKRRTRYEEQAGSLALESNTAARPEDELERAERRQEVQQTLAQMKPRSAQLLVLRHSGLSYTDLAAALKVKPTSVGKMLARAADEFEMKYRQRQGE